VEIEELFGLPAHPLVVHAAVVLLPLAALGTVLCAAFPQARRRFASLTVGVALAATLAVGLAQGSGEALEERIEETALVEEHEEMGESVLPWAIGVSVAAIAVAAVPLVLRRRPATPSRPLTAALVVLALVAGTGATWTVIEVGHSGAKATWDEIDQERAGD
jgi:hypothetical protein